MQTIADDGVAAGCRADTNTAYLEAAAETDAENKALAEGADWGDEFTKLEEALRDVRGVGKILLELGLAKSPNMLDVGILAYLGDQLLYHQEDAQEAFRKLHSLHYVEGGAQ